MKKLAKILTLAAASSCLLFGSAAMKASHIANKPAMKKEIKLMYVIRVKQAELVHVKGSEYRLLFNPSRIMDNVLAFSDRPNRVTFKLTYEQYLKLTGRGVNSFVKDPPNVVLAWTGSPMPQTFTMTRQTSSSSLHESGLILIKKKWCSASSKGGGNNFY